MSLECDFHEDRSKCDGHVRSYHLRLLRIIGTKVVQVRKEETELCSLAAEIVCDRMADIVHDHAPSRLSQPEESNPC